MKEGFGFPEEKKAPLYIQIQEMLKEMVEGTEYAPGDQIPSERELADKFQASRMTVRRAIESLVDIGLLERRTTSGTYVREPQVIRDLSPDTIKSLSRQIRGKGGVAGSKLLMFEKRSAPKNVSELLHLKPGEGVYFIRRLRLMNNLPFCIEYSYLPITLFPDLTIDKLLGNISLYKLLTGLYDIRAIKSLDKLDLSFATEDEAKLLGLEANAPLIYVRSIIYSHTGTPFEYVKSVNHPFRVSFQIETHVEVHKNKK